MDGWHGGQGSNCIVGNMAKYRDLQETIRSVRNVFSSLPLDSFLIPTS